MNELVASETLPTKPQDVAHLSDHTKQNEVKYYEEDSVLYAVRQNVVYTLNGKCEWKEETPDNEFSHPEELKLRASSIGYDKVESIVKANDDEFVGVLKPLA